MRILIFGINYSPEQTGIGPYTAGLARHLSRKGHVVEVLTGLPSYPEWKVHEGFRWTIWRTQVEDEVTVHRRWHYVPRRQSAAHRLAYEASFLVTGLSSMTFSRPDLILGIVPTLSGGVLARIASRRFHAPYALILQDLMGPAVSQTGVSGAQRVASVVTRVERSISKHAMAVGIVAEGFRRHLHSLGVEPERIQRVRNWARIGEPTQNRATTRKQLGLPEDHVLCVHAGNMGHKQGLENIVHCARLAQPTESKVCFILMGDGNQSAKLKTLAASLNLKNLHFLSLQTDEQYCNVLHAADILLLNQRAGVSEMSLPSKLTSYMASGRPVIAAVERESEAALELTASEAGIVIDPNNPEALLSTVLDLIKAPELREVLGNNGRTHAANALSERGALINLENIIEALSTQTS